ncbi:MAG TPA: DUF503 domain-containing protein [Phycisphaerae bacterium]|jgi:hypothetical protein|nr:DUF503 domain-containing protein [Phycisphaerae bacterium]HPC22504.1 DUF503 domain-containing protein [Phycisphaerae bacterium]HRS28434.1 DUF503 domain-containing protein [Phycisphaerae bacterium]
MVVGVLRIRLGVFEALSLKDKRRVVKGLKDRLAARHNISIAEVDDLDHRQAATLAMAMVANQARYVEGALSKIVDEVRATSSASLLDYDIELL